MMRRGSTTDPEVKSRTSGQLNWMMLVVSSWRLLAVELMASSGESESDRAGLTRAASFRATRLAFKLRVSAESEETVIQTCFASLAASTAGDRVMGRRRATDIGCEVQHVLRLRICYKFIVQ